MSYRQIILDTETTGLKVEAGNRIIEIACIEMINRKLTGKEIHYYVNPEREIEPGALAIHGISKEFLADKPLFNTITHELIDFISGAELLIHNAPFDVAFLNEELKLTKQGWRILSDYCLITDTLAIARALHVGQRNNLDALCKRYNIDYSKRELHGALLDTHLLAQVYLAMTGGQSDFFADLTEKNHIDTISSHSVQTALQKYELPVIKANAEELKNHENYLKMMKEQGKCQWLEEVGS